MKKYITTSVMWVPSHDPGLCRLLQIFPKWVACFEADARMISADTSMYLKGLHNALNALYMADKKKNSNPIFRNTPHSAIKTMPG